jgi:hypothetical protein
MSYHSQEFLDAVKESFKEDLDNEIELLAEHYDWENQEWDADKIKEKYPDIDDIWSESISYVVQSSAIFISDCWDVCREEIVADDFADYNDIGMPITNIHTLATVVLDQKARSLGMDNLFEEWLEEQEPPVKETEA